MIRKTLKALAARVSRTQVVRSLVVNIVYPSIVGCLHDEIQPDTVSSNGIAEEFAWKTHSYIVLHEELREGVDCAADGMRSDAQTRARLFDLVIEGARSIPGDILEFGVHRGESVTQFAEKNPERRVYGFDSFEGLPEDWWTRPKGTFKTPIPEIDKPNVELIKGFFDSSLPIFLDRWENKAAILHIDCDLYTSTISCLTLMIPRSQPGTIVLFDEYYNYSDFASHEWRAWREICKSFKIKARCVGYDGRRAAFEITELCSTNPKETNLAESTATT